MGWNDWLSVRILRGREPGDLGFGGYKYQTCEVLVRGLKGTVDEGHMSLRTKIPVLSSICGATSRRRGCQRQEAEIVRVVNTMLRLQLVNGLVQSLLLATPCLTSNHSFHSL